MTGTLTRKFTRDPPRSCRIQVVLALRRPEQRGRVSAQTGAGARQRWTTRACDRASLRCAPSRSCCAAASAGAPLRAILAAICHRRPFSLSLQTQPDPIRPARTPAPPDHLSSPVGLCPGRWPARGPQRRTYCISWVALPPLPLLPPNLLLSLLSYPPPCPPSHPAPLILTRTDALFHLVGPGPAPRGSRPAGRRVSSDSDATVRSGNFADFRRAVAGRPGHS